MPLLSITRHHLFANRFVLAFGMLALVFVFLVQTPLARAQASTAEDDPWAGVEEMVVSGVGGVAELLKAPSSVVAFDSDDLAAMGTQNVGDLAEFTPNLEITSPFAASNPQLFIRGVGLQDSNSNAASAVAVIVDGVYMASPAGQLSQVYDAKNVEILRGPQGALIGRNASAGAIVVTSNPPTYDHSASLSTTYGRFEQVDVAGHLNTPVVDGLIATRFAFKVARRDFLGQNRCARFRDIDDLNGQPEFRPVGTKCNVGLVLDPARSGNSPLATPERGVNNRDNWAARNLWLFEPTDELSILFNYHITQNRGRAPSFQLRPTRPIINAGGQEIPGIATDANGYLDPDTCLSTNARGVCRLADFSPGAGEPYNGDYSRVGDERLIAMGANVNIDWERGPWRLDTVVAWEYNDREAVIDIDASPYVAAESIFEDTADEYFLDSRLTWNDGSGIEVILGATALYDRLGAVNTIWVASNNFLGQDITQKTWHAALFGHIEWDLTETLTLSGGARINYERKGFEISSRIQRLRDDVPSPANEPKLNDRALAEEFRPSGEIVLEYSPTEDLRYYWRFSRGYKGRHFNGTAIFPGQSSEAVQPEFVNALEAGFSFDFLDQIISWSGAAYFYDYENQQVFQLQDSPETAFPVNTLLNAKDSRLIGGETELGIVWEGFETRHSLGVQYSEFSDFRDVQEDVRVSASGGQFTIFRVNDFSGNQLVNSPELSYVAYAQYAWEIDGLGIVTPRFDWRYKSRVFYTAENDSRIGAEPRWILDARLSFSTFDSTLEVSAWIRNITDEIYPVTAFDRKDNNNAIVWVMSDPRTYGVSASLRF